LNAIAEPVPELLASAETDAFHRATLVWDCLSLYYVLDEPYATRMLRGGVDATNVTFGTEGSWDQMVAAIEFGLQKVEKSPVLMLATCADDVLEAKAAGKLAVIMGTQGSMMVDNQIHRVNLMHRLGLRYFGLAYTAGTPFADGCGETRDAGVSFLGRDLIAAVNALPMILDLSHCGHQARADGVELARAPVCTHSNAYGLNANDRNTKDDTARKIAAKGGVLGICGLPRTVWPTDQTIDRMIDHVDYYAKLIGWQHVGVGCDLVEAYKASGTILPESRRWRTLRPDVFGSVDEFLTQSYPRGLTTILELPNFTQKLFDRGYTQPQVAGIMGGNWMRNFREMVG